MAFPGIATSFREKFVSIEKLGSEVTLGTDPTLDKKNDVDWDPLS